MNASIFKFNLAEYEIVQYENYGRSIVAYFSILILLGFLGNVHVFLVFGRTKIISNYQIFILALAINDILVCTFIIPFESVYIRYNYTFNSTGACKFFRFLSSTLILSYYLLLGWIAIERYRRICLPFRGQLTKKIVLIVCGIVSVVSCLIALPILIHYEIVPREIIENKTSLNGTQCAVLNDKFKSVYFSFIFLIATAVVIIIIAIYFLIARVLLKQRRFVREVVSNTNDSSLDSNKSLSRDNTIAVRNTITLMTVTAFSYIGLIPILILVIINFADENLYEESIESLGKVASNILRRGYLISNIVNPFVYIMVDRKFRAEIIKLYLAMWTFLRCKK